MSRPQTLQESLPGIRRLLWHFWPQLRRHRLLATLSFLSLFLEVGLRAVEPWPLKLVFDRVLRMKGPHHSVALGALEGLDAGTMLTLAVLALILISALRALADYGHTLGFAVVGSRVLGEVRAELYRHLQGLSLSFHAKARSGELLVRVIADINVLKNVTINAVLPMVANLLIVVGLLGVMFWLHWKLAVLLLTILVLFWFWAKYFTRRIQQASRRQRQREGAMAASAAEAIEAIKLVQALCLEGRFLGSFTKLNQESLSEDVKGLRLSEGLARTAGFLIAASTAAVLWYGARLALLGEISPGELLVFLAYLRSTLQPVQQIARQTGRLAKAVAAGERVVELLEQTPEVRDLPRAVRAPPLQGAVRFDSVCFAYEPGRPVLEHVDLDVCAGQHIALVGPSGMGKSTLVSLLLRLYDPQQGRVMIDGRDVRDFTLASLRPQISVVLQDTLLFAASVSENIGYGAPEASADAIEAAARLANAHEFIQALPDGYQTVLGERGVTLSGGERQRIAIARAAIRNSSILILDEPTTGLDEENERLVVAALKRISEGRTCFFITHDLRLAATADRIVFLERGRVLEQGTHAELMDRRGCYASWYRQMLARDHAAHKQPVSLLRPKSS